MSQCGSTPTLNCIQTYRNRGTCYFDNECASNQCLNGACAPANLDYPKVVASLSYEDYEKYAQGAQGCGAQASQRTPPANVRCKEGMILVDYRGKIEPYCPIPNEAGTQPTCQQAYQTLWQCDQFKDRSDMPGSQQAYEQCKRFEESFAYNLQYPDGSILPVAVKMTPEGIGAANAAVAQTASRCTTCTLGSDAQCSSRSYDHIAPFVYGGDGHARGGYAKC